MQIHNLCVPEKTKIRLQKAQSFLSSPFPPRRKIFDSFIVGSRSSQGPARSSHSGPLHVDSMRMLLAQWFVFLGVEWLPLQIHMADLGRKTEPCEMGSCSREDVSKRFQTSITWQTCS